MKHDYSIFLEEHKRLWMNRNKGGGIDRSMKVLVRLDTEINEELELLNGGLLLRGWERLKDRTIAAAAGLFL